MAREQDSLSYNINRISYGTEIVGTINTNGDIRIDGSLEGALISNGRVVIGEKGYIKGDLRCNHVDIWGTFEGSLVASESTMMKSMATLTGDVKTTKLCIEVGARFNGSCTMPAPEE